MDSLAAICDKEFDPTKIPPKKIKTMCDDGPLAESDGVRSLLKWFHTIWLVQ